MSTFYVLGIDQSTQGTKAVLFDRNGKLVGRADAAHRQIIDENGWISHNPSEIYENVLNACKKVIERSGIDASRVSCVGITNQRETTVVWDKNTKAELADAVVWQCNRAKDISKRIEDTLHCGDEIYKKTGLKLSPYYPAAKLAWLIENAPRVRNAVREGSAAFGTVDSWLLFKLTDGKVHKTDYSNASRTQLLNLDTLEWDEGICGYFGIDRKLLPEICDSDSVFGETTLCGLLEKPIPICGVLGDSHGALFGHNCRQAGGIKATYGTGSSVMLNTGEQKAASKHGLSTSIAWKADGRVSYVLEGNINYTGAVISWLKDEMGIIGSAAESERLALQANEKDETYIVPAFSGLGAPWWKNDAKAIISGMSRNTGKKELVKAACDCIAYQINDVVAAMREDTDLDIQELCVDGGPTRNRYLMQFQSDISKVRIKIPDTEELSVTGAAYLAGIAAGVYDPNTIFSALSYGSYDKKMENALRDKKIKGWEAAVRMVINGCEEEKR